MIQCARCAAANQPTSKYCLTCGSPLPAAQAPVPAAQAPAAPAAAQPQPANPPPPAAWGPPGYGPPPGYGAQPPGPAPGAPPAGPPYGPPPGHNPQGAAPQYAGPDAERFRFGSPDGLNPYGATVGPSPNPQAPPYPPPGGGGHSHEPSAFAPTAPPVREPPAAAPPAYNPPPGPAPYNPQPAPAYNPQPAPAYNPQPPAAPYQRPTPPPAYGQPPQGGPAPYQPPPGAHGQPAPAYQPSSPAYQQPPVAPPAAAPRSPSHPPPSPAGRDPEQVDANAPRVIAGFLVSYEGNELGAFWPIHQGQNQLGRKGAAPGLDIEIDHPTTSSRHAVLYASARPARLKLEDSGSTNGTFLRDQQLERGRRYEVQDGDVVRLNGTLPETARDPRRAEVKFRSLLRSQVLDVGRNQDLWASDRGPRDLTRALAWVLAQPVFTPIRPWADPSDQGVQRLQQRQFGTDTDTWVLLNDTRWGAFTRWVPYLGFGWWIPLPRPGQAAR